MPQHNKEKDNKETLKRVALIPNWKTFGFEVFLFSLSLILGILSGYRLKKIFTFQKINYTQQISFWQFLIWFVVGTFFILSVVYFVKVKKSKQLFLEGIFLFTVAFGTFFFFSVWVSGYLALFLTFLLLGLWLKKHFLLSHNLLMIFAVSGIGAGVGLRIAPETVFLLLLLFSVYDYIAVYKTKHMVRIAETMIEDKAVLGLIVPQSFSDLRADLKKTRVRGRFLVLGAGDVVFPLIFSVSFLPANIYYAVIIGFFSALGLFADFLAFLSQKRKPLPALPLIAGFSAIGYLLIKLI
jgi:presenilin-like A22 family membrane protease